MRLFKYGMLIVVGGLAGCSAYDSYDSSNYSNIIYEDRYHSPNYQNHAQPGAYNQSYPQDIAQPQVEVPNSYHVGERHSPVSHKSRDKRWVYQQNPGGYTIEVASGAKATSVASKLHGAPRQNRRAQVTYQQNGQTLHQGLYGSYSTYEEAQQALSGLPNNLKSSARIKQWSNVQNQLER